MARLIVFVGVVVLGVAAALFLISERSAITGVGYRVARLEAERRRLIESNRKLEAQAAALKTPSALADRVRSLQLDLVSPDQLLDQQAAREKEREKEQAKAGAPSPRPKRTR